MERKLLVLDLDLDHTFIYPSDTPLTSYDFTITVRGATYWIKRRPHLDQFLNEADDNYDLMLWSASESEYVHKIVDKILPPHLSFVYIYTADRCTTKWSQFSDYPHPYVIKDLKKVWRRKNHYTKKNTLVLDDTPKTYMRNYGNVIPIDGYYGGEDQELLRVLELLDKYESSQNVRVRKRDFSTQ